MRLEIKNQDILLSTAQAIILSIDGYNKGMEGKLAREFEKAYPTVWNKIESFISYPLPMGKIKGLQIDGNPFNHIIVASLLPHIENISYQMQKEIVFSAYSETLNYCVQKGITHVTSGLLTCGWRLQPIDAFTIMTQAIECNIRRIKPSIEIIEICILDETNFKLIQSNAMWLGW